MKSLKTVLAIAMMLACTNALACALQDGSSRSSAPKHKTTPTPVARSAQAVPRVAKLSNTHGGADGPTHNN